MRDLMLFVADFLESLGLKIFLCLSLTFQDSLDVGDLVLFVADYSREI